MIKWILKSILSPLPPSPHARVLGETLDSDLSFQTHFQSLSKSSHLNFRNMSKIWPLTGHQDTNSLLLSLVLNIVLPSIFVNLCLGHPPCYDFCCRSMHLISSPMSVGRIWQSLPLTSIARVKFKILTTYKAVHNSALIYIKKNLSKDIIWMANFATTTTTKPIQLSLLLSSSTL